MQITIEQIKNYINEHENEMIDNLSKLISVKSISSEKSPKGPFGDGCGDVLEKALEIGSSMGFKTKNYDNYCGELIYENGEGDIGFFSHLDVVPVGLGWSSNPFEMIKKDGYLIGRGVNDDKGPAIAAIYAVRALMALKAELKKTVRIYLGCSEETGMEDMEYFKSHAKQPEYCIVPDAEFPVCCGEKGILTAELDFLGGLGNISSFYGGEVSNKVCEQAFLELSGVDFCECEKDGITVSHISDGIKISALGISSHAAMPEGSKNAIKMICDFALENSLLKGNAVSVCKNISDILSDNYGEHLKINLNDKLSGKLTCISGIVLVRNSSVVLNINIRYPVTKDGAMVIELLKKAESERNYKLKIISDSSPAYVSPDSDYIKLLCDVYSKVTGKDSTPYTIGGGTYARHLTNAVAFGAVTSDSKHPFEPNKGGEHQADEAISIDELKTAAIVYAFAILEIDKL